MVNEVGATGQRAVGRTVAKKRPQDYTGQQKLRGEREKKDAIAEAAERMAMTDSPAALRNNEPIDYTEETRLANFPVEPVDVQVEVKPRKYKVRVVCDIEKMVFGREVIDPGDFDINGRLNEGVPPENAKMPLLGGLRFYDFEEGQEYIVDGPLYEHLRELNFIYE